MKQYDAYEVFFNGTSYAVSVEYEEPAAEKICDQTVPSGYVPAVQSAAQAPWVTARRIAHLPSR